MKISKFQLASYAVLLLCQTTLASTNPMPGAVMKADGGDAGKDMASSSVLGTVLRGKSRQSRCVRCYEDRYYGSSGSGAYSGVGYSSRSGDDRSSWYYPPSYDRYDDRSYRDRYDDRYSSSYRDERYPSRTYDRYESRGYDDYRRGGSYSDRDRGYAYESRDRYAGDRDRYGDYSRDRYYDRYRPSASYDRYERDPYDRYSSRYDYRNYRPWDETYRGQSGFDNSGRGYYFATEGDNRPYSSPYDRERERSGSPCGLQVANCPYGGGSDRGTKVSSSAIDSGNSRGGHTSVIGKNGEANTKNNQGSWTYMTDQDKDDSRGSSGSSSSSSNGGGSRNREQDQQSTSYGGRPPRPLGGSYLFDRESNVVMNTDAQNEAANAGEGASAAGAGTVAGAGSADINKSGSA